MGKIILVLLLLAGFTCKPSTAQKTNRTQIIVESAAKDSIKSMLDEYEKVQLPPLSVFLESAQDHPSLQIYKARVDEEKAEMEIVKRAWLDYIRGTASYQYGYNNTLTSYIDPDYPVFDNNKRAEHRYSIGATLSVPLGNLFSQKQKRKKQEAKLNQLKYEYEISLEERKLIVLQAYNTVVEQLATIKVKAEAAALYNAQMKISEDDYMNGKIDIIALSLERRRRADALSIYQESRVALHNAITLLEMLTNVTIMKK